MDARSILDILLGGSAPRDPRQPASRNVFKDMLDQLGTQQAGPGQGAGTATGAGGQPGGRWTEPRYPEPPQPTTGPQSLEDLLRSVLGGGQPQAGAPGQAPPPGGSTPEFGRELQDLLRQVLQGAQGGRGAQGGAVEMPASRLAGESGGAGETGMGDLLEGLKQVLDQATAGVREGAGRIDEATGISGRAREALGQVAGQTPEELVAKVREMIGSNQLAAGAALGGLGALLLGTSAGRSAASTAVKLGGLALIGGLAYKAFQNYQQGRPILAPGQQAQAAPGAMQGLLPAPEGSGFEAGAMSHDTAQRCIRAMIAAAAADGRIDAGEQQRILGGLRQAGLDDPGHRFLAAEITSPATVAELASGVASPEEAVEVYTAARLAVEQPSDKEHAFLAALGDALGIDDDLAAQVDAAARSAAA